MSQTAKIVLAIVVIVIIGGIVWYSQGGTGSWSTASSTDATALPSGSDTSDAALDQDMASIDTNIQTVDADSADANQSVDAAGTAQ